MLSAKAASIMPEQMLTYVEDLVEIDQDKFKQVLYKLSPRRLFLLDLLLADLLQHNLMNAYNATQAITVITFRLAAAEEKQVDKLPREDTWTSWLLWCSCRRSSKPRIFTEKGQYLFQVDRKGQYFQRFSGGLGTVKLGRHHEDTFYAVKKNQFSIVRDEVLHVAKHEVRYANLAGYESYYFIHHYRMYVVTNWCNGDSLAFYKDNPELKQQLLEKPLILRIKALLGFLNQLHILHSKLRVHGDIKPENCIYRIAKDRLLLIDFGGAHNVASQKRYSYTREYTDLKSLNLLAGDMFGVGHIMSALFPELVESEFDNILLRSMSHLQLALFEPNAQYRCSCYIAIRYCQELIEKDNHLDQHGLEDLLQRTLNHDQMQLEDVLAMTHRPLKFAHR